MSSKYHISVNETPPRFPAAGKLNALEREGCLGCRICVKRTSCVYDVYRKRQFDPTQVVDTTDVLCINCMRCVQECKKNILERTRNPQHDRMGDDYWQPDLIASLWKQAETGRIPVSGAGYRGPFVGPGFDSMWTDMSEIVRPTRDGIHGREYISTVIELGRRPAFLEFDAEGRLLSEEPRFVEIPIPMILQIPDCGFVTPSVRQAIAQAAGRLGTIAGVPLQDAVGALADQKDHLMARFDPKMDHPATLNGVPLAEIPDSDRATEEMTAIRASNPAVVVCIRVPLDEHAVTRAVALASAGADVLHLQADRNGRGLGRRRDDFLIQLVREVHLALLNHSQRDQLTLLVSGGIAMAEHVAKILPCGVDGVVLDTALLVAMECRLCPDCSTRTACPVEIDTAGVGWAANRIVNLVGSWHSQLIEVMGAMGLREVRRLRGELGRVMFFSDLERENLAPVFGTRSRPDEQTTVDSARGNLPSVKQDLGRPDWRKPGLGAQVKPCPTRFRNTLGIYKVVRTSACTACGTCAEVCQYGVHVKAGKRMLAPKAHLCQGFEVCRGKSAFCMNHCPTNAIRVGLDQTWQAFGDPRWPAELLAATWKQAETGSPPEAGLEYRVGRSGGGFDRIELVFPDNSPQPPADVDLRVQLNRRRDGRPEVTIGVPFYGGGMSFGSISLVTILARAAAYTAVDSFTCTGEGGYLEELRPYEDHVITQVATGLFGVREETIQRARMVEFKYAQGAKPGLGGHLLGDKNTAAVAKMREAVQGVPLFSPFPFHSVYSVEDHKKHVDWIKEVNTTALISVKVSGASDVDMVAVGSYYAGAHVVHLDGSYGGTGAAPDIAKKNIAMPIEYAVPKVHRFLLAEGVRDQVTLVASGGVRTAWDIAKVMALGANAVVIGTAEMVALECIRCGACESGRGCARGIATTDPELSVLYSREWATQRLINLFHSWSIQLQQILWSLGLRSINDLVGRSDVLEHLDYERRLKPAELQGAGTMNRLVEHILTARGRLIEGRPAPQEGEGVEEGGCGVVGFAASVPVKGRNVFQACMQMHNRGNGKGGGIAAAGLVPDQLGVSAATLRENYLIQIALLDPQVEGQVEESFLASDLEIAHKARVAHLDDPSEVGLDVRPPEVTRYFARVKPASLRRFAEANHLEKLPPRALEDEFIYQNSFKLNQRFYASLGEKQAFVLSHARDLLIFKIVGYAEQVVKYYRMDDFKAHLWIAHQRYPTKGRVWHPAGAHPFIGMNEALVHNGDFANYFSITEHLRQHNVVPQFLTDTEVSVLTYDLLHRTFGYPLEYVIEALAPTTELDFDRLPAEKKKVYRAIQSMHMHGSPDGPWFFIIASSAPDEGKYRLVGITDTAMLRPQVFALQEGEASIGLIASEKQAIDATLQTLSAEDARFRPVADMYWNARGGSHKDGGSFVFTVDSAGTHAALTCADKFGNAIVSPPGEWRWKRTTAPAAPDQGDALAGQMSRAAEAGETSAISAEIASCVATWGFANVRWVLDRIRAEVTADRARFDWALGVLLTLNDRRYYCGALKRSVVVQQIREAIDALLDSVPSVSANGSSSERRVDWRTRDSLRPPGSGEKTLVICARGFQAEGEDCDSRVLVRGYRQGWRSFIVYGLAGQRFTGCGLGAGSSGVRIEVLGSSGDYLASGIDGLEIHVHDNGQDQLGQIMKQGTLVVHGDVGQAFMYGAKGGEVYVLGNTAGRPLINGVGRPRVIINGTCLDFLAESFMAGDPLRGGGFVVLNGVRFNRRGQVEDLETPYPGANLFSMASGGAIYVRDPGGKLVADQLNGGEFVEMTEADWDLIHPYLLTNERHFGITVEGDLLRVGEACRRPQEVYRKVQPRNGKTVAAQKPSQ